MEHRFFGNYGNTLFFANANDFDKKISRIDVTVPPRTAGRTAHHRERYCIVKYLRQLNTQNLLRFPFELSKEESPDFVLRFQSGQSIGIEHTDFGSEQYQRALDSLEREPANTSIKFSDFDKPNDLRDVRVAFVRPGEKLSGAGWEGNKPEEQWVELLNQRILAKTEKLNRDHFSRHNRNELLLYDNSHVVVAVNLDRALLMLVESRNSKEREPSEKCEFDTISVVRDSIVAIDVFQNPTACP